MTQTSREGWFKINGEKALLEFSDGSLVAAPFDPIARLPMFHFFDDAEAAAVSLETASHACVSEESNHNLMRAKKEMLRWHWRLGHPSVALVKWMAKRGLLGRFSEKIKNVADHDHPMCASCNYGKQSRRPTKSIRKVPVSSKVGSLKKEKLEEGDLVATDQFVVRQG